MPRDPRKSLEDIRRAADAILRFTAGRIGEEYRNDLLLRSAVERQFEIIGEALGRLAKEDAALASQVSQYRQIISFRNVLIHGYDLVDDAVVWDTVKKDLPVLKQQVEHLLAALGGP